MSRCYDPTLQQVWFDSSKRKRSLHSEFPRVGWISLLASLGNVALQIYSHLSISATFLSSVNLNIPVYTAPKTSGTGASSETGVSSSNTGSATNGTTATVYTGPPTCLTDRVGFDPWWDERGRDEFSDLASECGPKYILESPDAARTCILEGPYGYTFGELCLECFVLPIQCVSENCLLDCGVGGLLSDTCNVCMVSNDCNVLFEECAGVSLTEEEVVLDEVVFDETLLEGVLDNMIDANSTNGNTRGRLTRSLQELNEPIELFEVYSISFVDSIRDAADGGAWYLVIALVLLSGIWPYLKNVIMMIAWFVPMTDHTRSTILIWLTRFAKWSLVDVFVIVVICAGVRIDTMVQDVPFILVGEPRIGIITFCLAAVWDLSQGEWMRKKQFQLLHQDSHKDDVPVLDPELSLIAQIQDDDDESYWINCTIGRGTYLLLAITQGSLLAAVISTRCMSYEFSGLPTTDTNGTIVTDIERYSYTTTTMATSLLDEYGSLSPGGTIALVGSGFMTAIYLAMCIVLPAICLFGSTCGAVLPSHLIGTRNSDWRTFFTTIDILSGFACLDVWLLALALTAVEFNDLVGGALSSIPLLEGQTNAGNLCITNADGTDTCVTLTCGLETAVYLAVPAVLLTWVLEAQFGSMESWFGRLK